MSATPFVEVCGLRRWFGNVKAVNDVSFSIPAGQVAGLIGANGAGKTTTMRILATLDRPDRGTVRLGGIDIVDYPNTARSRIGWMPDHFVPYRQTSVADYLDFFARTHGLRGDELRQRVQETAEFTDLVELADRPTDRLSKGQSQRLCLARTLLSNPDFLILDEPAAGLDPKARLEFKGLVRVLREQGKTTLISSHILTELAEMCDTLIFMDQGAVMHQGATDILRRGEIGESAPMVTIRVQGPVAPLLQWLATRPGWRLMEELRDGARAEYSAMGEAMLPAELRRMIADNIVVAAFHRNERHLEETFVEMLREPGDAAKARSAEGTP